ncbi:hypothetical protein TSAR_012881, partial [Trichomalopsis sarcophagae]
MPVNHMCYYRYEVTENVIISLKKLYNGYIGWSDVSLIVLSNMRGGAERRDLLKYSDFMVVFGTVAHDATLNRDSSLISGETMDDRYERTRAISARIRLSNYRLIEKWECDFIVEIWKYEELQRFVQENTASIKRKPLDPRDAFFGSRVGNTVK